VRFKAPKWGVFCHTERLRDHPARLKLVLSDSTLLGEVQDERIQQLGRRLVAFNARHLLDDKYQNVVQEYLADKWSAGEADVGWATIASVHAQLSELEKEGFDESLLEEMRTFYRNRIKAQGCSVDF